jgi:DNA mismatch repair protein MutS
MAKKLTPMMEQYYSIKSGFSDCILFFRLGDFYEMFEDDALVASEILEITLTARGKDENKIPMCGVPYHSAEGYIAKLTQKGKKVAICEQVGSVDNPGIVERDVVRVITPGTNISDICLENKANQFVSAIKDKSIAFCDVSTGELMVANIDNLEVFKSLLATYQPKELVAAKQQSEDPKIYNICNELEISLSAFDSTDSYDYLTNHFNVKSLNAFGLEGESGLIEVTALTLQYLESVLKTELKNIQKVSMLTNEDFFDLDHTTIFNLEIFHTIRDFDKKNSLIGVIDKTVTSGGGRLFRRWMVRPLKNLDLLNDRLVKTGSLFDMGPKLEPLTDLMKRTYDLERVISRVGLGLGNPRDLGLIVNTLFLIPEINNLIPEAFDKLDTLDELKSLLENALAEDLPLSRRDGGIFKEGYNAEVDELRKLLSEGKGFIANLKQKEIEATGISNLKVGFNKVFGYFLEVSKGKVDLVPDHYIRKQTLTNSERYITPELKEYEDKVLNAEDRLFALEENLFIELTEEVMKHSTEVYSLATALSTIDVHLSFANLALSNRYVKPELTNSNELEIVDGRHPVLEAILPRGVFIPNDLSINASAFKLITGPNMGGKSTYLRQVAIVTLLAQVGSFVPAQSARIGLVDQIYTRVGAADNLSKGQSTFMVEMEETAYILRNATEQSLLILDEIGRGTSTYDGLSIAWSVTEFIHDKLKSRALFATHYHELVEVVGNLENAENLSVTVEEDQNGRPVFLHKIQKGAIDKSYGVHVAELAGLPKEVLSRSEQILNDLEKNKEDFVVSERSHKALADYQPPTLFVMNEKNDQLTKEISDIDINSMTPLEALQKLVELKDKT